jgi:ornithine cyclodeaminase
MVSAMAAVVPPFTGGKIYATRDGKFTFLNVLFDFDGRLLCTLDGDALTALRTPATCALAIRALGDPATTTTAAVFGAGRQGWRHVEMLRAELPALECVRIVDVNPSAAEAMVSRARDAGIPAEVANDATAAIDGAGVVVTITQSTQPLFAAGALSETALICAVGATKYDRCEIGADVVARCGMVVCDDVVGSRIECGDLIQAHRAGRFDWDRAVELHAVLAGTIPAPSVGAGPVLFETQGVALQDVAAAGLAWQRYNNERTTP